MQTIASAFYPHTVQLCSIGGRMKSVHRGDIVRKLLAEKAVNISKLVPKLSKVKRAQFYVTLHEKDMDWELIREIGEHSGIRMRDYFPDMPILASEVQEEAAQYANSKLVGIQQKYIETMEKLNLLMEMVDAKTLERYHTALKAKGQ